MSKKIIIAVIVVALAGGTWLAWYFSDKQVIRRQMGDLAAALGKEGEETPVQMALKLREVKEMLAATCLVEVPDRAYKRDLGQDFIIRYLIYYRQRYLLITVGFTEMEVVIPATGRAHVEGVVRVARREKGDGDNRIEQHRVEITLAKGEDRWLIKGAVIPGELTE